MKENAQQTSRRSERRPAAIPVSLVLKAEHSRTDESAVTVDISLHGVSVRTQLDLVPGEGVAFVPKEEFPQAIPTRVVWVREWESSHWTVAGLEFLNTKEPTKRAL